MTVSDALWTVDSLLRVCSHEEEGIRAWAVRCLGRLGEAAAVPAVARALDEMSPRVVTEAVRALVALGDVAQTDAMRTPLRRAMLRDDLPPETADRARTLLLERGDPAAIDAAAARCLRGDHRTDGWLELARFAPDRFRLTALQLEELAPPPEALARVVIRVPRVARLDEVSDAYANFHSLAEPSDRARLVWELLRRCQAEHLFPWAEEATAFYQSLIDDQGAAYLYEVDEAHVQRWLSPAEFGPLFDAMEGQRWAEAIAWCAWWCDDVGGEASGARWSRALLALFAEEPSPEELHARAAACLAIAAGERAIEREHPFAECDIEEQFARACGGPEELAPERLSVIARRWRDLGDDDDAHDEVGDAFETTYEERGPRARRGALELAAKLSRFPLPGRVLDLPDDDREAYVAKLLPCLEAQPEALRALAPEVLDAEEHPAKSVVIAALGAQNATWAREVLQARFDSLIAGAHTDDLLAATRDLGDPALLTEVIAAWRPGEKRVASVALHLARLGHQEATLPEDLLRDAEEPPAPEESPHEPAPPPSVEGAEVVGDVPAEEPPSESAAEPAPVSEGVRVLVDSVRGGPLAVDLVCNRCKTNGRHQPGRAVVRPDLDACARDGWDGVTFERIIVCGACGAEDDYTLGPTAMLSITVSALGAVLQARDASTGEVEGARRIVGAASLRDGTLVRRASDALRYWRSAIERDPGDAEAWLRLGNVCKTHGRVDEAIEAYRRSITLRPKHLDAPGALLHLLIAEGRALEGGDLSEVILKALPMSVLRTEERAAFAELVALTLQLAVAGAQPLGFAASWPGGEVNGQPIVNASAIDLRRVTRWSRLATFIAQPAVLLMGLKIAHPDDADTDLLALIEGSAPLDLTTEPSVIEAPEAPSEPPASEAPAALEAPTERTARIEEAPTQTPPAETRRAPKIARNSPCYCGSGKKYKKCHGASE